MISESRIRSSYAQSCSLGLDGEDQLRWRRETRGPRAVGLTRDGACRMCFQKYRSSSGSVWYIGLTIVSTLGQYRSMSMKRTGGTVFVSGKVIHRTHLPYPNDVWESCADRCNASRRTWARSLITTSSYRNSVAIANHSLHTRTNDLLVFCLNT
jgi:hypothetical protein